MEMHLKVSSRCEPLKKGTGGQKRHQKNLKFFLHARHRETTKFGLRTLNVIINTDSDMVQVSFFIFICTQQMHF